MQPNVILVLLRCAFSKNPSYLVTYLFIICLEILAILIRDNKDIQGIQVDGDEIKLEIFADDLTVFLRNHTSLNALFDTIEGFTLCSGLRINYDKTEAIFWVIRRLQVSSQKILLEM